MAKKLLNTKEDFKNWAAQQFGNQAAPATGAASANAGSGKTQAQQEQAVRNEALERLKGESQMEQPEDLEKAIDRHIKGQLFPGYENSDKSVLEQIADNAFQAFPSAMRALRAQIGGIFGGNGGQQEQKPGTKFTFAGGNKAGATQAEASREYTGDEVNDAVKHIDELLSDKNLSWEDKIALQSDRNLLTDYAGGVVQHDAANNESVGAVIGRWGSRKAPETPETTFSFGSSLVADQKRLEALKAEREELISATMQYPLRVTDMAEAGEAAKRLAEILPQIRTLEGQVAQKQQDEQARQEAARESAKTDAERFLEGRISMEEFRQLPETDQNEVLAMYHVYGEDGAQQVLNRLNDEKQVYTAMGLTAQEFSDLRPELREEALRTWREDASHAGFYSMLAREDWSYGSDVFKPGSKSAAADQMELADRDAKKRQEEGDKLAADMEEERLRARYESMTPKDAAEAVRKIDEQLEAIKATGVPWQPIMFADENGEFPIVYSPTTSANIEKLTWARNELSQYAGGEKDFDGMTVADLIDQADQVIGDSENSEASLRAKIPALRAERDKYEPYTQEWKDAHEKMVEAEILADEAHRVENPVEYFLKNDLIRYRDAALSAAAPAMENMVGTWMRTPVEFAQIAQDIWDFTFGQIKQDRIDKDGNIRYGIPDVIRATTGYKSATDNPIINTIRTVSDAFLNQATIDNKRSLDEWTDIMVEQGINEEDARRYADLVITKGLTSAGASLGFMLSSGNRGPKNPSNIKSVIKSPQYWMMAAKTTGAGMMEDHELLGDDYTFWDMLANVMNGLGNSAIELYESPTDIDILNVLGRKLNLPGFAITALSSGHTEGKEEVKQEFLERATKVGADWASGRPLRYDPTPTVENLTKSGTLISMADYGDTYINTMISTQGINLMNAVGTRAAYATQNPYKAAVLATLDGTATEEQKDLAGRVAVAAAAVDAVAEQQEQKANGGAPTEQQQHDAFEEGLTGQGAPEDTQPAVNPIQVLDEQRRAGRVKKPAGAADALRGAAEDAQKGKFLPPEQVQQIVEEQSGDKAGEKPGLPELPENDRDQYDREESNQQLQDVPVETGSRQGAQVVRDQEPAAVERPEDRPEPVPVPARPEMREAEQKAPETMERPAAPERLVRPMDASGTGEAMDALVAAAQARTGNDFLSPEEVQAAVAAAQGGMEQTAQAAEETGKAAEEAAGAQADVDQDEKLDTEVNEPQQGEQESDRLDTDVTQPEEKAAESDRLDTDVNEPQQGEQKSDKLGTEINTPQEQAQADQNGKLETETGEPPEEKPQDSQEKLETQTGEPPEEQENDNARLDTETEQPQEQETANADARSDTEINDVTAAASAQETTAGTQERSGSGSSGGGSARTIVQSTAAGQRTERMKADLEYDSSGIELMSSREKTAQMLNQAQGLSDDLRKAGAHFASWSGGTEMDAVTQQQVQVIDDAAKALGVSAVFDSEVGGGKANGSYAWTDENGHKVIHIAQNAKNPLQTVFSHEMLHLLAANNNQGYQDLKTAFLRYADNAGLDVGALVQTKMELYERHGVKLGGVDEETGYNADALEEVIADALYDVIGDERAARALAAKNPGLVQSIKNWIRETLDKIHNLLNNYAERTPQAKMLRDQEGAMEELRRIMDEALTGTRPIREEKARVANVGSNGELTEKFQEAVREAEGREEMNKAAGELADGILKGQGLEASLGNRQRLYTAAGDFMLSGGTISEAMELFDLKWTAGTAEQNRAFAALGKYVQGLMERNDVEGFQELMEMDEDAAKQVFSLIAVNAVKPSNNSWRPDVFKDYDELKAAFPNLYNIKDDRTEEQKKNDTSIAGTVGTYRKIYQRLQSEGFTGTILDASSGMGLGTKAGREEFGFKVDDIEPFPAPDYHPSKGTDYSKLHEQYDVIISNAVLNVETQDQRDANVVKLGELLKDGGRMYINVRGVGDVANLRKNLDTDWVNEHGMPSADNPYTGRKNIQIGENEYYTGKGTYQKGFTEAELKAYLEDALGDGYTVEIDKKHQTSGSSAVGAVVTKVVKKSFSISDAEAAGESTLPNTLTEVYEQQHQADEEIRKNQKALKDYQNSPEMQALLERLGNAKGIEAHKPIIEEMKALEEKAGIARIKEEIDRLKERKQALSAREEEIRRNELLKKVQDSGKNTEDYFRDAAVKEFGYTSYFYDAGYILPNGKMLNFSGEKGKHFGTRGQDHRAIGTIYEGTMGQTAGMNAFINDGNIRIMDEGPGIDLSISRALTDEQEATVRRHILRSGSRGYHVDFTGPDGRTVQTLDYQPGTKAEKILSDIAQTVRQGKAPEQSVTAQFHTMYSFSEDEDTAEKEDFTLSEPVEETRELVAVHNLNEAKLEKALEDGGLIGPSIAVMKKQTLGANNHYGDISIIFRRDTIDPDVSEDNRLYGADAWTPMYDSYHDYENPEDVLYDMKRQPERGYEAGAEYVSGNLEDMDNAAAKIYRNVREMKDDSGRIQYDLYGNIKRNKQRLINEAKEMGFREEGQQTLVDIATLMTTRENLDLLKGEEPSEAAKRLIRRNLHSLRSDEEITKIYKLIRSFANLPTQYFEAKAMRVVKPEEWAAVVVPEKNRHLARVLKDAGIKVLTYSTEKGISTRSMVINEFAEQEHIKFSMMDQQGDDTQQGRTAAEAEDEWNLYSDVAGTDDNAYQLINNLIALRTRETENADGRVEHTTGAWKGKIGKLVETIAQQYGNGNKGQTERKVREFMNRMDELAASGAGARTVANEGLRMARVMVREIYGSNEENNLKNDLKDAFGGRTLIIGADALEDVRNGEGGLRGFRNRMAAIGLRVTTKDADGGFHLESEWEEVAQRFGLDPDTGNVSDQIQELDELVSRSGEYGGMQRALSTEEDRYLDMAAMDLLSSWMLAGSTPVVQRTVTHIDQEHQQKALDRIDELEAQVSDQADTIESQAQQLADEKAKTRTVLDQLFKRAHELEDLKRGGANRAELDEARKAYAELANKHAETVKENKSLEKKLEKAREKHRELHRELSEARKAEKEAESKAEKLQQRVEKQQARLEEKLEKQKDQLKQQKAKAKAAENRRRMVERIRKTGRKLGRMLASPKQNKYVPQDMVRTAAEFVDALLDNTGRKSDKAGAKLQRMIREARSSSDYNVAHSFDETLENQLNQVNELLNDKGALRNMSDGDIALIAGTAEQLMHQINDAGKLQGRQDKADIMEEATDAVKTFNDNPRELNGLKGVLGNYLLNHKNPQRVFRALAGYKDNAVARLGNELSEGQRRKNMLTMKATKCFEELTRGKNAKNFLRFTGEDQSGWTDIGVDRLNEQGKKVGTYKMTGEMKASFALHWASEENRKGMSIPGNKDLYQLVMPDENLMKKGKVKEAYQRGSRMTFTSAQARAIIDSMTEYEQKWVAAWRSMEEILQPAINETSMTLKHYRIATVENYFPIHRDRAYIASDFESIVMDRSLENMGFTKERVNARNPMLLEGLTDVINTQINSVSDYVGYAVPVKNFNKVYNAVMPGYADSVKAALYRTQGKEVAQYLEKLMSDIQGGQHREASFLDKLRGKYAGAVLTLNPAVTIKQAASYPTAASVLGWGALNKALPYFANSKAIDTDLIDTYTSAHWERRSEALKDAEGNAKNASAVRKSANKFLNSIQEMDVLTTKVLWKAAEFRVQETTKLRPGSQENIKNGTDAYYQAVARLYEQAIEETQPEYGVMQRPQILRHDSEIVRSLTMFKTQPLQNLGILLDSFGEMRAAAKAAGAKGATKADQEWFARSKQTFTRAVTSQVVSGVVLAIMTMVGKALLHKMDPYRDEKGDITAQSTGKQILSDTLGSWAGMVAGGSEIYELIAGVINGQSPFDIEAAGVSTINDLYQNLYGLLNSATVIGDSSLTASEKWEKIGKQIRKSGMSVAQMLGLPVNNMMNLMDGLATNGLEIATGVGGSFREESALGRIPLIGILLGGAKGRNVSNTKVAPYIAGAMADGDQAEAVRLYNEQLRQGKSGQAVSTAIKTQQKAIFRGEIQAAAEAIESGDVTTYNNLINQMTKGGVNMAKAVSWVETERKKIGKAGAEENNESAKETAPIRLTYDEIMESLLPANAKSEQYTTGMLTSLQESGNLAEAKKVYQKLLETREASSIQSSMTSYWKPQLVSAYERGDMTEVKRIKSMLMQFGYKEKTISGWTKKKKTK